MTQTRKVNYLIIGAGMAGTVLEHFLQDPDVVVLDHEPGGYKIGESIIPEHFHHPEVRAMVPKIKELPSYSPKWGSTFVGKDSIASFPLPPHGAEVAMHVSREELEPLMHEIWNTPIVREKVTAIDLDNKVVTTDATRYQVAKQIIDCSGPAMVLARLCGEVSTLWPVYSRWAYFDIESIDDSRFWARIKEQKIDYRRYDIPKGRVLPSGEQDGWKPSKATILTEIEQGLWTWQIPMFAEKMLSVGVVSRHGTISSERLNELAIAHAAPHYQLKARPQDKSSSYNREHQRNGFAIAAKQTASPDFVLMADACAFADPIFSVGTGLAVNKAIELAAILNEEGWTDAARERWVADYGRLIGRAVKAFDSWYDGSMLRNDEQAQEVQRGFLVGRAFQVGIAHHYSQQIVDAGPPADQAGPDGRGRHIVDADADRLDEQVAALLGIEPGGSLAGWKFDGAVCASKEVQQRWSKPGKPQLVINMSFDPATTRYFRRVNDISLSFMNLLEKPYPFDDDGVALFDALEPLITGHVEEWEKLGASS